MKYPSEYKEFFKDIEPDEISDPDVAMLRWQTCLGCEMLDKTERACNLCGCYMPVKTWLAEAECPIQKW